MDQLTKRTIDIHDDQYRERGIKAQRLYPSEQLVQFIAMNYFALPVAERNKVKVLEVGCGNGRNLWMLAKEGFDTYGVDGSATSIELARTHLRDKWGVKAHLETAPFDALPFPDNYFDAVCDVFSLLCVSLAGARVAFRETRRVLKPGGLFFSYRLSDASTSYQCGGGKFVDSATVDNVPDPTMPLNNNGQMSFWSPALARMIYEEEGFTLQSVERFGRTYDGGSKYLESLAIVAAKA
jgi:ubiquinone/menaquinone biosynthesis C-methylase UbiE